MAKKFSDYLNNQDNNNINTNSNSDSKFSDYLSDEYKAIPFQNSGKLDNLSPGNVDYNGTSKEVANSDWWNDLKQSWDSTQLSAYKYSKAKAKNKINLASKRIAFIKNSCILLYKIISKLIYFIIFSISISDILNFIFKIIIT